MITILAYRKCAWCNERANIDGTIPCWSCNMTQNDAYALDLATNAVVGCDLECLNPCLDGC